MENHIYFLCSLFSNSVVDINNYDNKYFASMNMNQ